MTRPVLSLAPTAEEPPASDFTDASCFECAYPPCSMEQSEEFWPFCSQTCCVRAVWDGLASIQKAVDKLNGPLVDLRRLDQILDGCPFGAEARVLQVSLRELCARVVAAQRDMTKSSVEFNHDATRFTDLLPALVESHDGKVPANSMWMTPPDEWEATRDKRWQRGAMSGSFIQHWLSYHVNHTESGLVMVVYRTPMLKDTDDIYQPVQRLLADGFTVLHRETMKDKDMMFGQGELTIYALER